MFYNVNPGLIHKSSLVIWRILKFYTPYFAATNEMAEIKHLDDTYLVASNLNRAGPRESMIIMVNFCTVSVFGVGGWAKSGLLCKVLNQEFFSHFFSMTKQIFLLLFVVFDC